MDVQPNTSQTRDSTRIMRKAMVDSQLRTSDVTDRGVVAAMNAVAREDFVPDARAEVAYTDRAIPLGNGRSLNPPLTTGRMLVLADLRATDRVLVIGAATGYSAALLARLAGQVVALEEDADLAERAATALARHANVAFVTGPLAKGWAKGAPYDVILIDGAVEHVPDTLAAQLSPTGRVVVARDDDGVTRICRGIAADGRIVLSPQADIEAAPLPGFARPRPFSFR